ncbi:hypothetical protein [Arachidicoccus sp.]|uniref:hypothetical protein n=1 Tax=Arachidicoccus sp. TaxID=1872624 RepID=UPI003D2514CF
MFSQSKPVVHIIRHTPTTFEIHNTLFEFDSGYIKKYQDNKWLIIDTLDWAEKGTPEFLDIDKNGFQDIGLYQKYDYSVYLFDPKTNVFVKSGIYSIREFNDMYYDQAYKDIPVAKQKMQLLSKRLHIYFDYQMEDHGYYNDSYLFQIKNYKRINLGWIIQEGDLIQNRSVYVPKILMIYKAKGSILDETLIDSTGTDKVFNYATYWKHNWQKFLPEKIRKQVVSKK